MLKTQSIEKIFECDDELFFSTALLFFQHQSTHNIVYRAYLQAIHAENRIPQRPSDIPFLPIPFFKQKIIRTSELPVPVHRTPLWFESSGTTGQINSRHDVPNPELYETSFMRAFEKQYGDVADYCILGLLPSYLEREHSSLVYMVRHLMKASGHPFNDFYLHDHDALADRLRLLESTGQKTLLIGVTYALLDFAEKHAFPLQHTVLMETGGMKGRRDELIREEVHDRLRNAFSLDHIHSEYGMTELLSQAYAKYDGLFTAPPWMKVMVRDVNDPFEVAPFGKGVLNVIDLANIHSCCFVATEDIGEVFPDGSFKVSGRLDASDLRGCSLMVAD